MIVSAIQTVVDGRPLPRGTAREVMEAVLTGQVTPAQFGALVVALRLKGETADEIAGLAESMRAHATRVDLGDLCAVDACGTGGDGVSWFSVTTTAALIAAGAGAKVAKHGNRAASSKCGSADVLEALGVQLAVAPTVVAQCVREAGMGFMFAQAYHPGMKFAAPLRREVGIRTVFNLLGPITNPAGVRRQLLGVADPALTPLMADALRQIGAVHVLVVAGHGGVDEITLDGPTQVTELRDGSDLVVHGVSAEDMGLAAGDRAKAWPAARRMRTQPPPYVTAGWGHPRRQRVARGHPRGRGAIWGSRAQRAPRHPACCWRQGSPGLRLACQGGVERSAPQRPSTTAKRRSAWNAWSPFRTTPPVAR